MTRRDRIEASAETGPRVTCPACAGGRYRVYETLDGRMRRSTYEACPTCGGRGYVHPDYARVLRHGRSEGG